MKIRCLDCGGIHRLEVQQGSKLLTSTDKCPGPKELKDPSFLSFESELRSFELEVKHPLRKPFAKAPQLQHKACDLVTELVREGKIDYGGCDGCIHWSDEKHKAAFGSHAVALCLHPGNSRVMRAAGCEKKQTDDQARQGE